MPTIKALVVADQESEYIWDHFDRTAFAGVDVIISCGDLNPNYLSFLTTMIAAPLLYVPGNHDVKYINHPPEGCDDLSTKMQVIKGVRFLGFGGCNSKSPKPYHYSEGDVVRQISARMTEIARHGGFDVLVTHTPAAGLGDGDDAFHKGFMAYRLLLDQFRPSFHFHGHQHANYGPTKQRMKYDNTVIVNGFGYQIVDITVPDRKRGRISYIKMRYEWRVRNGRK